MKGFLAQIKFFHPFDQLGPGWNYFSSNNPALNGPIPFSTNVMKLDLQSSF